MAWRLAALGRQAALGGGVSDLFDGAGNGMRLLFKGGAVAADVDDLSAGSVIATLAAADGSYSAPSDDATNATTLIASNITGNASATYDYADANDGAGHCEVFRGSTLNAANKVGDFTVGGPGTTGTQDFNWNLNTVLNGQLLTITALTLQQS